MRGVDKRPIITTPKDILPETVLTQLNAEVLFESKPENYGINNFMKTKEIIALFVSLFIFIGKMLSIYKFINFICRQILASSLPNKIAGYLFRH